MQTACTAGYSVCIPSGVSDVDCAGGGGDGPVWVQGPVKVTGADPYGLDRDACDAEFLQNMRSARPPPSLSAFGKIINVMSKDSRDTCLATADEFYVVVRNFGESKFQTDTSTLCEYNGPGKELE